MDLIDTLQAALGPGFRLERELTPGGMSRVFLARDLSLDRDIVVKVLPAEETHGTNGERFRSEIQLIARLQHPLVVPVLAAGSAGDALWYAMPFMRGESLRALLTREQRLPIAEAVRIAREVLDALAFAHGQGVVHRDIKPENVLLDAGHAIVADFGIAKALRASGFATTAGIALGTPTYMAPEQAVADPSVDHRADLYAVGVLLHEMLAGTPPFSGSAQQVVAAHLTAPPPALRTRRAEVPAALEAVVLQALAKDADARPASAKAMSDALQQATVSSPPAPAATSTRRRLVAGVAAVAVLGIGAAAWAMRAPVAAVGRSLVVLPMGVPSGDSSLVRLGRDLVSTVSVSLDGVGELRMADAGASLALSSGRPQPLSADDAAAIARKLGASSMVTGTLSQTGTEVRLDAIWRATDDSLTVLARVNVRAPAGDLNALTDSLTWQLLRQAWRRGTAPSPYLSAATTRSLPALRAFLEAERRWADGDLLHVDSLYRQAFELDSTFYLAAFRYRAARIWTAQTPERAINARLMAHLAELPERERQLALVDSAPTTRGRFERLEAIVARWPDYAPGWMMLGDGIMHGIAVDLPDPAQSVRGIQRWSELAPGDLTALGHLQWAASMADDAALAREATARLDSVMAARGVAGIFPRIASRTYHLLYGGSPPAGVGADVIPDFAGGVNAYASALARNPAAAESLSRAITTAPLPVGLIPPRTDTTALRRFAFMNLGDFSARTVELVFNSSRFNPILGEDPMFSPRTHFLMRFSGLSDATPPVLSTRPSSAAPPRLSPSNLVEIDFMRGALAASARDSVGVMAVIRLLSADTTMAARASVRSLRALMKGYASPSQQLAAADTLLAVQLDLSRHRRTGISLLGAAAVAASPWFAASGRYGAVDTLTRIVKVYAGAPATIALQLGTTPVLLLERAKALAALGRREEAWIAAKALAVGYPLASAGLQPLVAQGKALAAELEQSTDRSPRVPVPTARR